MKMRRFTFALSFVVLGLAGGPAAPQQGGPPARRVIIFVWDGLRADDVTPEHMPNYVALARSGVVFADHHAVYPTFTMMNSASIATGTYPGMHGFYGNVVYAPNAKGKNAKGVAIDFLAPAFIEDFGVVEAVRDSYQGRLTLVSTMLQAAQAKGLTTAAVGKFGAAFIQDYHRGGIILDEDAAIPLSFAKELQNAGYALPKNTVNAYSAGAFLETQLTNYLRLRVAGGYQWIDFDNNFVNFNFLGFLIPFQDKKDLEDYYANVLITHRINSTLKQSVSAGHESQLGVNSNYITLNYVRWTGSWNIIRNTLLSAEFFYEDADDSGGFIDEHLHRYGGALTVGYQLTPHVTLGARYQYTQKDSDVLLRDYKQNRVSIDGTYSF